MLITAAFLNWQLMLVMLGCIPFIGASVGILTQMMSSTTQEGNDHYSKAGGVATEVGCGPFKRAVGVATETGRGSSKSAAGVVTDWPVSY